MSHDVAFQPRTGTLDLGSVRKQLAGKQYWEVERRGALYRNPDTGFYLTLDLNDHAADRTDEDAEPPIVAAINVYRPSFFGLECAEILAGLAAEFDLVANEVGNDDAWVDYSTRWFIDRWNVANLAGYSALRERDPSPNSMSTARLIEAWEWNRSRAQLQEKLEDELFVPKISPILLPDGLSTAVVWTDAIPFALPSVEHVIVYRNTLLSRKRFRRPGKTQLQTRAAVLDVLGDLAIPRDGRIDFLELPAPAAVSDWVAGLDAKEPGFTMLQWDHVHDAELLTGDS
jgi:hypothetical protein